MGFFDAFRGGSAREEAAKAMEAKKMDKMMKDQAAGDAYKAGMAAEAPADEKKYPREQSREFTAEQLEGAAQADALMEAYKRDADMATMFKENPAAATELRDALAEKAGSGASPAALAEYGTGLIETLFPEPVVMGTPVEEEPVVMGTVIEEEEEKAA